MKDTQFLTEKELAGVLKCSQPAIRVWRRRGLPVRRFGRLIRFELPAVLSWFENQQRNGAVAEEAVADAERQPKSSR